MSCSALIAARCHGTVGRYRLLGHRELPLCEACVGAARRLGLAVSRLDSDPDYLAWRAVLEADERPGRPRPEVLLAAALLAIGALALVAVMAGWQ